MFERRTDNFFFETISPAERKAIDRTQIIGSAIIFVLFMVHVAFAFYYQGGLPTYDFLNVFLITICTSLFGYLPSLCMTVLAFIGTSVLNAGISYRAAGLLLTAIVACIPASRLWYRTIIGTVMSAVLYAITTVIWFILLTLVEVHRPELKPLVFVFFISLVPSLVTSFALHLFFTKASDKVKQRFWMGAFYTERYQHFEHDFPEAACSRLSFRILCIIVAQSFALTIAAIIFANFLRPNMTYLREHMEDWRFMRMIFHDMPTIAFSTKLFLLLMNVTVPITLFANYNAQKSIAFPLRLMTKAMQDFTSDTTKCEQCSVLDINLLGIKSKDEIGELYDVLKIMTRRISGYIEQMEREKQLESDLKVAQAESKAKTTFLSNMSHEIRTPINAVLGFDEMILREATDPVIVEYAQDIRNSGKTLLGLINDILDFSKIEAGKMEILPVQYELSSAINDLVNMIQKKAEDKHLALHVNVDKDTPHMLYGDEVRLKQCILNILTNAVKYTHAGSVTMNIGFTKKSEDTIALSVQIVDTGIGIKQEDLKKLFTAFERIEEKRNRSIEGTGLGMNIVQQLLSMMGSSLMVKSEYGKGSDFSFTVEQKVLNWDPIGDVAEMYRKSLATEIAYKETFTAPSARILVVDDTPLNLKVVQGLLKQTQVQIDTAESGQVTLELVQKQRYDVIFIDHRMPGMDGVETLHEMQRLEHNKNAGVPCIALTANAISGAREYYLMEGFTDYLSKPIDSAKLEKQLIKYLPADKVQLVSVADTAPQADASDSASFPLIEGVDIAEALKNCGSVDTLREAFKDFYASIPTKSAQIAEYAASQDWKNYTVLVHALKSSARLIGAAQLSEDAKYLESCGDQAQATGAQNAIIDIAEKTPALLALYQSYAQKLQPVAAVSDECAGKKPITQATLESALSDLRGVVSAFDFGTADAIVEQLDGCQLPESFLEQWKAIKQAISNVDQGAVMALLEHDL